MKHQYLLFLFALLALPIRLAAQDEPAPTPDVLYIDGVDIIANPNVVPDLTCVKHGAIAYDADSKTLTLTNATLEAAASEYIIDSEVDGLTIVINGANTITSGSIRLHDTEIKGGTEGSSLVSTNTCYILARQRLLTFTSTYVQLKGGGFAGIDNRSGELTINDADVIISGGSPAIRTSKATLNDCTPTSTVPGTITFNAEAGTFIVRESAMGSITLKALHHHDNPNLTLRPSQERFSVAAGAESSFSMPTVGTTSNWNSTFTYTSSNPEVISISGNGQLSFHAFGETTITVTALANTQYIQSSVSYVISYSKTKPEMFYSAKEVTLPFTTTAFRQLPTLTYGGDGKITIVSSDPKVLMVDVLNGVHLMGVGTATITATAAETNNYASATASYTCAVTPAPEQKPSNIHWTNFSGTVLNVEVGQESQVFSGYPIATCVNGYDGSITYTSSNPQIVRVDTRYGSITPITPGRVTITATAAETDYYLGSSISYIVNYYEPIPDPIQPDLAFSVTEVVLQEGVPYDPSFMQATINSDYDGVITYSSSNPNCIDVDSHTGKLIFYELGTAVITAKASATARYLEATASYTITFAEAPDLRETPTLVFTPDVMEIGIQNGQLVKVPLLMVQYNGDGDLSFASDNESVAAVDEDGNLYITAAEGTATITVTSEETNKWKAATTTFTIRVADQTAVPVGQVKSQTGNAAAYDLSGRKLPSRSTRGIIIMSGRKVASAAH